MPIIHATQVIERPIDEVFATVADAANFHTWNPTITSARRLSDAGMTLGAKFEWKLRGFGTVVQQFGEFERNKCIRIVPQIKGLRGGHRFTFTKQGSATRIDHELTMVPTGWFRLLGPVMGVIGRRNLRDTTRALQTFLESRARVAPESARIAKGAGLLMRRAEIENLVLGIYRATETGNVSIIDDVAHDDVVEHPLNPGQRPGREPLKQLFGALSKIIPDLSLTVEDVVSKQDMVAVRSVVRGTPAVAFLGVPPKGQVITFGALDMWRVARRPGR